MRLSTPASTKQVDLGLALLRVVTGAIFAMHGGQKLFVYGFAGVSGAFGQMGVPMPEIVGPAIALLEFVGGLALVAGLLTRPVAFALALDMIGALFLVHLKAGFFLPNGYEFALALFGAASMFAISGAGAWSLDSLLSRRAASTSSASTSSSQRLHSAT